MKNDITDKLVSEKVQKMLEKGSVIAFIHPETFSKIKHHLEKIKIHPNLHFMEIEKVDIGMIHFAEQPSLNFLTDQLFTDINEVNPK